MKPLMKSIGRGIILGLAAGAGFLLAQYFLMQTEISRIRAVKAEFVAKPLK